MVLDLMCQQSSLSNGDGFGENVIIFGVDNSSSARADNRKNILILGKDLRDRFDDTKLIAEAEYSINFSEQENKFH